MKQNDRLEETAGVGNYEGVYYMWALDGEEVTVVFESGGHMRFQNDAEGWTACIDRIAHLAKKRHGST